MTGPAAASPRSGAVSPRTVDLRAYACPHPSVKSRIALERLAVGEQLELWLPAGEAVENVPRSAVEEGHRVLAIEPLAAAPDAYRVLLEKGAPDAGGLP